MNNKKKIKKAYLDVNVSSDLERKILNMTINKEVKKRKFKLAYLVLIAVVITGFSLSFAYAKEIKEVVQKIFSLEVSKGDEEGNTIEISVNGITHDIPNTIKRSEKRTINYNDVDENGNTVVKSIDENVSIKRTFKEVEKDLGFPILKLKNNDDEEVIYTTSDNSDGTIASVHLEMFDFYEENGKECNMDVDITDESADYIATNPNDIDVYGGKADEEIYHTDNIKEDILIYAVDWDDSRLTALFYHDGIKYTLVTNTMTRSEFKTLLDNLKY